MHIYYFFNRTKLSEMLLTFFPLLLNLFTINVICFEEDVDLTTPQLINKYGYPVEIHSLTTLDGYKLTLHRIPYGKKLPFSGIPVLIAHSLMCSSATWVDNMNDSLGFILADEKFDVWLGNFRGNSYTSHSLYSKNDPEFWNYSAEELAEYDLPAFINYIQHVTGYQKILLVGQSLGSAAGFYLFSSKLEYNDKVAGFVAMAPVASVAYKSSPVFYLIEQDPHPQLIKDILKVLGTERFLYFPSTLQKIGFILCDAGNFCDYIMHMWAGYSPKLLNATRFPVFATHCREGTSVKTMVLFDQQSKFNRISRYDYGKKENLKRYGTENPPIYNLSEITVPIALFTAPNDAIASPLDVEVLKRQLRSEVTHEILPDPFFNHLNFMWSHPAEDLLYGKVVKTLRNMWDNAL